MKRAGDGEGIPGAVAGLALWRLVVSAELQAALQGIILKNDFTEGTTPRDHSRPPVLHGNRGKNDAFSRTYLKRVLCHPCQPVVHHSSRSGAHTDFTDLVCFAELRWPVRSHYTHHSWDKERVVNRVPEICLV